jgi:hypothetical protein
MGVWDDLKKRVKIVHAENRSGIIHTEDGEVWKPTPRDLDHFEQLRGLQFPDEYREFAQTFGPGKFGRDEWCIYMPGIDWESEPDSLDIDYLYEWWIHTQERESNLKLILFCEKRYGSPRKPAEYFGWNPEDVTDPDRHEYGIYRTYNESQLLAPKTPPTKVASTFREFVRSYALGGDPGLIPFRQTRF